MLNCEVCKNKTVIPDKKITPGSPIDKNSASEIKKLEIRIKYCEIFSQYCQIYRDNATKKATMGRVKITIIIALRMIFIIIFLYPIFLVRCADNRKDSKIPRESKII